LEKRTLDLQTRIDQLLNENNKLKKLPPKEPLITGKENSQDFSNQLDSENQLPKEEKCSKNENIENDISNEPENNEIEDDTEKDEDYIENDVIDNEDNIQIDAIENDSYDKDANENYSDNDRDILENDVIENDDVTENDDIFDIDDIENDDNNDNVAIENDIDHNDIDNDVISDKENSENDTWMETTLIDNEYHTDISDTDDNHLIHEVLHIDNEIKHEDSSTKMNQIPKKSIVEPRKPFTNITNTNKEKPCTSDDIYKNVSRRAFAVSYMHDPGHSGVGRVSKTISLQTISSILKTIENRLLSKNQFPTEAWLKKSIKKKTKSLDVLSNVYQYFLHFTLWYYRFHVNGNLSIEFRSGEHQSNGIYQDVMKLANFTSIRKQTLRDKSKPNTWTTESLKMFDHLYT